MNKQAKIFIRTSKKNYRKLKTSKKIWFSSSNGMYKYSITHKILLILLIKFKNTYRKL